MTTYSFANTYIYRDKPAFVSTIDCMFSPLSTIFDGKTVDLLSGIEKIPAKSWVNSPHMKVATLVSILALSIVFPAFGAVFAIGAVLKAGCSFWEKTRVLIELEQTSRASKKFQEHYGEHKYSEAISVLEIRPQLAPRWKNELLDIGNQFAKSDAHIGQLPKVSEIYASNNESIALFRHIMETKFKQDMLNFNIRHIDQWINNLGLSNQEAIIYCYSIIDLFKPEEEDAFLTKMLKLNAGIGIIDIFENYKLEFNQPQPKSTVENKSEYDFLFSSEILYNFDGMLVKNALLEKIKINKPVYNQFLQNKNDFQHLSYLVSAIRNVKKLEADIQQVRPQLNEKHFNVDNPVANLKYKKKIIAHAKLFLERIEDLHYKGNKQINRHKGRRRRKLPFLSERLNFFMSIKQKNIKTLHTFYKDSLQLAEELLTQSENTLKFNAVKFKISVSLFKADISCDVGHYHRPPDDLVFKLYMEYFNLLKGQFEFIDKVFDLICLFEDLNIEHQENNPHINPKESN